MEPRGKKKHRDATICESVTSTTMKVLQSIGRKIHKTASFGDAVYVPGSFLYGQGDKLCRKDGKGIGELILKTIAPAVREKKEAKGRGYFRLGPPGVGVTGVLLTEPADVRTVMETHKDDIENYDSEGNFSQFLGTPNILGMPLSQEWRALRTRHDKVLLPENIANDVASIQAIISRMFNQLDAENGVIRDLEKWCAHYTMNVMAYKLGISIFSDKDKDQLFNFISDVAIELGNFSSSFVKPFFALFTYPPFKNYIKPDAVTRFLNPKLFELIDQGDVFLKDKILSHPKNQESIRASTNWITLDEPESKRKSMDLTTQEVRNLAVEFLSAGTDTTTNLANFCFYFLTYPKFAKYRIELLEEINKHGGDPASWKMDDFNSLAKLDNFVNEVLRLHPSIAVMLIKGKSTYKKPFTLDGGVEFVGGEYFFISPYLTQRSQAWGKDANEFNPDRFADQNNAAVKDPHAFIRFGWAPRKCPGRHLATLEIKMLLTRTLHRYRMSLNQKLEYPFAADVIFTMKTPLKEVGMKVEKRPTVEVADTPKMKLRL